MKTARLLLFALLFTGFPALAQDSLSSRLKLGLTGSADYCSYLLYVNNDPGNIGNMFYSEKAAIGWSTGATCSFSLNGNFALTGGLRFTEHNIADGPHNLYDINRDKVGTFKLTYHTRYIDVPLGIQFNTNQNKRLFFIADAAISPGYAMGEWNELDFEGEDTLGISDNTSRNYPLNFNQFSLKAELYAGIGINVGRYQLQVMPQGRYCLLKATSNSFINRRYLTAGIEFRLLYTI